MINPNASNYNYPLPKVTITASQVGTKVNVSLGGSFQQAVWIEINNESPYILSVFSSQGILLNSLQPQICDIAQVPRGDTFFILVPNLLIPQASPSFEVDINVYPFAKPIGAYPFPLGRQAVPTSPANSGSGFSSSRAFNSAPVAGNVLGMNLFNPANSGKNLLIYLIRLIFGVNFNVAGNTVTYNLGFTAGADLNLSGGNVGVVANNTQTPVTSQVHSTFTNNQAIGAGTLFEAINFGPSGTVPFFIATYDFVPFPDQKLIPPGTNVTVTVLNTQGGIACIGGISFRWNEQ